MIWFSARFFAVLLGFLLGWSMVAPAIAQPLSSPPVMASLFHFSGTRPSNLGVSNGRLAICPSSPNCVSSQSTDSSHQIAPLPYSGSATDTLKRLVQVVQEQPGAKIVATGDRYLYAEFTSALMGFVDDVEFYLDDAAHVVHVRSASRLGESDLGVNRKRIETIREKFQPT
jgi:uncharacterized protein (DUF1499 family)